MSTTATEDFIHAFSVMQFQPSPETVTEATTPAIHFETLLRRNMVPQSQLDPYLGLIDIFDTSTNFRKCRPRAVPREWNMQAHRIFAHDQPVAGSPSCVDGYASFRRNWDIFTHGVLKNFDRWDNVVVAGGSVLACLAPPQSAATDRDLHELFRNDAYSSADIDIFLWGLSPLQVCTDF